MGKIKLDSRLKMVAELVREGKIVADIGTDHAYLLSYLIQNEVCPSGIAGDVKQGPLDNAIATVNSCNLQDKIKCVLSNGLENISPNSCEDIVIAGMGGILITQILTGYDWLLDEKISIVAQPMTHAEDVRKFFVENGFEITKESACIDAKRLYCAICARYTGIIKQVSPSYYYVGELAKNDDTYSKNYLNHQFERLSKKYNSIKNVADSKEQAQELKIILDDFNNQLKGE